MNMDNDPTVEQLRALIRFCNDSAGNHILWIARNGEVKISRVPRELSPERFQQTTPEMQLRYETFEAGNEYVGPEAADDEAWVSELFDTLLRDWPGAKGKPEIEYVGQF